MSAMQNDPRQGPSASRYASPRGSAVRPETDMAGHPDTAEMRERYARVLDGPRASAVDGLILLTGAYTAISPWIVHFQTTNPIMTVNNLVLGLALAALGLGMALRPAQMLRLGWAASVIGVWLIISPWVASLGHSAVKPLIWNNAFAGGAAVVLGLAAMGLIASLGRRGGQGAASARTAGARRG